MSWLLSVGVSGCLNTLLLFFAASSPIGYRCTMFYCVFCSLVWYGADGV